MKLDFLRENGARPRYVIGGVGTVTSRHGIRGRRVTGRILAERHAPRLMARVCAP